MICMHTHAHHDLFSGFCSSDHRKPNTDRFLCALFALLFRFISFHFVLAWSIKCDCSHFLFLLGIWSDTNTLKKINKNAIKCFIRTLQNRRAGKRNRNRLIIHSRRSSSDRYICVYTKINSQNSIHPRYNMKDTVFGPTTACVRNENEKTHSDTQTHRIICLYIEWMVM